MTKEVEFLKSLETDAPPPDIQSLALALWYDAKGNWEKAHQIAQEDTGNDAAWLHAYLHRKEGDLFNAAYWYRQAGRPITDAPLEEEWRILLSHLNV